ncbi:HET domain-containing protein [Phlyctema vagabunda]|uniref:HET domain-containing protein n=1 Tax=Phlyctema vagabunda TaxID=108571 RepID=A0ABR4P571_9HELO
MDSWYKVVSQYSGLQLTYRADIFPAISGIAKVFNEATGFQYVAGIWLEDIHSALLWYRLYLGRKDVAQDRRSKDWRAPSWSWASLEGPVQNLYESTSTHMSDSPIPPARIVRAEATLTEPSGNPFAAIKSSRLQIYALCTKVWCKTAQGSRPFNDPYLALILDIYGSDGIMFAMGYRDSLKPILGDTIEKSLAVVISQRSDQHLGPTPITYFLLVVPVGGSGDEVNPSYERIGIGHTADSHTGTLFERDGFVNGSMQAITVV